MTRVLYPYYDAVLRFHPAGEVVEDAPVVVEPAVTETPPPALQPAAGTASDAMKLPTEIGEARALLAELLAKQSKV